MTDEATWKRRFRILGLLGFGIGLVVVGLGLLGAPLLVGLAGFMLLSVFFIVNGAATAWDIRGYGGAYMRWSTLGGSKLSPDEAVRRARWLGGAQAVVGTLFLLVAIAGLFNLLINGPGR